MAFDLKDAGNYGSGNREFTSAIAGSINTYAQVTAIANRTVTISTTNYLAGTFGMFAVGDEVLIHVSAVKSGTATTELGKYIVATVTNIADVSGGKNLTLSKDPTLFFASNVISNYYVQCVNIPSFASFTTPANTTIQPTAYVYNKFYGGIVTFKVKGKWTTNAVKVNLVDKGIPVANAAFRPLLEQEKTGVGYANTDKYSAYENWMTHDRMLMNTGDGVAFILAETIEGDSSTRFGNPSLKGVPFNRGVDPLPQLHGMETTAGHISGGSTLLIVCDTWNNFDPANLSKYRTATTGQGLARCYVASKNTVLPIDEGLYSYDVVSDPARLTSLTGISSFGDGSFGDVVNYNNIFNTARVINSVSSDGHTLNLGSTTQTGLATLVAGAMCVVITPRKKNPDGTDNSKLGRFKVCKILSADTNSVTLNKTVSDIIDTQTFDSWILAVPQFNNYTQSQKQTDYYSYSTQEIIAMMVKGTLDLRGGHLHVAHAGDRPFGAAYKKSGLDVIGNAQDFARLPIGEYGGSVLIIAKKIIMNSETRIGSVIRGDLFAGHPSKYTGYYDSARDLDTWSLSSAASIQCGYFGIPSSDSLYGYGGNPAQPDHCEAVTPNELSGFGGSRTSGCHLFIVADEIVDFQLSAIATGGFFRYEDTNLIAKYDDKMYPETESPWLSGASYGACQIDKTDRCSGGGFIGAGIDRGDFTNAGGSGGFCFIYANKYNLANTKGLEIY